jgi:transposase
MDASGLPLAFSIFRGNDNEQGSLKPLEKKILKDFELSQFVVCTDAGLSSEKNRIYNTLGGRGFITTQSIKKLKKHVKEWALDPSGWHVKPGDTAVDLSEIDDRPENPTTYFKERWINEGKLEQRLLVTYSPKYKHYQQAIRNRQIERAMKKVEKPSSLKKKRPNDPTRFIQAQYATGDGEVAKKAHFSIDEEAIQKEAQYDGFYGVCTNLKSDPLELIRINHQRWEIEESFRIMKSELKSRPVFVRNDDRVEAHFLTCFLALLIYRILEQKLGEAFTCPTIIQKLREMKMMKEPSGEGYIPLYERDDLTDALHKAFGFRTDYEIVPIKEMKKILRQTKKAK